MGRHGEWSGILKFEAQNPKYETKMLNPKLETLNSLPTGRQAKD
jgi:hypothetical protein